MPPSKSPQTRSSFQWLVDLDKDFHRTKNRSRRDLRVIEMAAELLVGG